MGIVFFGASKLGFECCKALVELGLEINAIFSIPQDFSIKYKAEEEKSLVKNVLYEDFSFFNKKYGIPVKYIEGNSKEYQSYIEELQPDLIVVIGWYYSISKEILNLPKFGSIALHASLLPKYRGNAPLVWAMINGEKSTGVSLFYLEEGIDSGDIIEQKEFLIEESDTISEVLKKTEDISVRLVEEQIPKILLKKSKRTKQDHSQATYFPRREPKDGKIDWSWDSHKINLFIKAQTHPYPGAYTIINGKKVVFWSALVLDENIEKNENL